MGNYYKKTEEKLSQKVTEWKVCVSRNGDRNETVVEFNTISPAGEDFYATVVIEGKPTVTEIAERILAYQEDFNPVAEALLWVDSEGHGKNGAPDLEELIADKKHMKQEMLDLYNAITRKTKKEETMRTTAIVGDTVRIINMEGEPKYAGKIGIVTSISPAYPPLGILEQIHGTWGGCAIQPERDSYEILEHA